MPELRSRLTSCLPSPSCCNLAELLFELCRGKHRKQHETEDRHFKAARARERRTFFCSVHVTHPSFWLGRSLSLKPLSSTLSHCETALGISAHGASIGSDASDWID